MIDSIMKKYLGEKSILKKVVRKINKMSTFQRSPEEMKKAIKGYSDEELLDLKGTEKERKSAGEKSAREFQLKLIDRELKKRGLI